MTTLELAGNQVLRDHFRSWFGHDANLAQCGGEQAIDVFVNEVYGVQNPDADLDEARMDLTLWLDELRAE